VLDAAELFDSVEAAIGDCTFVLAATARRTTSETRAGPEAAAAHGAAGRGGATVGVMSPPSATARKPGGRARRPHRHVPVNRRSRRSIPPGV